MGLFRTFFQKMNDSNECLNVDKIKNLEVFSKSIYLSSVNAYLMAVIYDESLIYFNNKDKNLFIDQSKDGTLDFPGRLYKIDVILNNGHHFYLFYGIVTDDPIGLCLLYDSIAISILREIHQKIPSLINLKSIVRAPTSYTYTCFCACGLYLISNTSGSDSFLIRDGQVICGERDYLLNAIF